PFSFPTPASTTTSTLSLHDALPISSDRIRALIRDLHRSPLGAKGLSESLESFTDEVGRDSGISFHLEIEDIDLPAPIARWNEMRSEEHTSELQSRRDLVCRLLLEKK